jgi:hypothetical protein
MSQGRKKVVDHCKITPFEPHDGKLPSWYFSKYSKAKNQVMQLIPSLVWKVVYVDGMATCLHSPF